MKAQELNESHFATDGDNTLEALRLELDRQQVRCTRQRNARRARAEQMAYVAIDDSAAV